MAFVVRTELEAAEVAFGLADQHLEFIQTECSLGDWTMDSVQGKMEFSFADERDAILFKLKFA